MPVIDKFKKLSAEPGAIPYYCFQSHGMYCQLPLQLFIFLFFFCLILKRKNLIFYKNRKSGPLQLLQISSTIPGF